MAGIIIVPIAASIFIGAAILGPFTPSVTLFGMPLLLSFSAVFNLNISWLNYWYSSAKLNNLPWWNILYAVLSIIGILPSFILVIPGFISIIFTILLTPIWLGLEVFTVATFFIWAFIDPNVWSLPYKVLKWVYCVFG